MTGGLSLAEVESPADLVIGWGWRLMESIVAWFSIPDIDAAKN